MSLGALFMYIFFIIIIQNSIQSDRRIHWFLVLNQSPEL